MLVIEQTGRVPIAPSPSLMRVTVNWILLDTLPVDCDAKSVRLAGRWEGS